MGHWVFTSVWRDPAGHWNWSADYVLADETVIAARRGACDTEAQAREAAGRAADELTYGDG